ERYDEFRQCPGCDRLYWAGSHYQRMQRLVDELLAA
ncbi:MAG: twitching motility protein PilT, partial [Acidobacteria bacterium]|nr:twitching motility protein PilT [Acidobacteriota bacterium]